MNDDQRRYVLERARRLQASCEEPGGLNEIIGSLRKAMMEEIILTKPSETVQREELVREVRALDAIKATIGRIITAAAADREELDRLAADEATRVRTVT